MDPKQLSMAPCVQIDGVIQQHASQSGRSSDLRPGNNKAVAIRAYSATGQPTLKLVECILSEDAAREEHRDFWRSLHISLLQPANDTISASHMRTWTS